MSLSNQELIAAYRKSQPDTAASDDLILGQFLDRAKKANTLDQFPELREYSRAIERESRPGLLTEIGRGLSSGVDSTQAKLFGTAQFAGEMLGFDELASGAREGRLRNEAEAAENPASVSRFEDVAGVADAAYLLAGLGSRTLPGMVGTIGAAAAGTLAAPVVGIGATVGGIAAAGAAGFTQMQNYGELRDSGVGKTDAAIAATAAGGIGAALESLVPLMLAGRVAKAITGEATEEIAQAAGQEVLKGISKYAPVKALAEYGTQFAKGSLSEGATEFGQELVSVGSEIWANRNNPDFKVDEDEIRSRLLNAAVGGGLIGGPVDVATTFFERNVANTPRGEAKPGVEQAQAVAPLGDPETLNSANVERAPSFRYNAGDPVLVVDGKGNPVTLTEVESMAYEPAAKTVVYTVNVNGKTMNIPEAQIRIYDPESPDAKARERKRVAARDAALKQELVTPEIEATLIESGLTDEEISAWSPDEVLTRYAEVRKAKPANATVESNVVGEDGTIVGTDAKIIEDVGERDGVRYVRVSYNVQGTPYTSIVPASRVQTTGPKQASSPAADAIYRDAQGRVTRGRVPAEGIQGDLFDIGRVNTAPTNLSTVAEYQGWREGQLKARANANLARMRNDQDAVGDLSVGPIAPLNPAAAQDLTFNTDGRQTLLPLDGADPLESTAETLVGREVAQENASVAAEANQAAAVGANKADLLADSDELKAILESRGAEADTAVKIIDALVNDAGGWDNPDASISRFVQAAKRAQADDARAKAVADKAAAAATKREERVRAELTELKAKPELIEQTINTLRAEPAKFEETLSAARLQARSEAQAELALVAQTERERALEIARDATPEANDARLNLQRGWLAGLGPIAYAETFRPTRLQKPETVEVTAEGLSGTKAKRPRAPKVLATDSSELSIKKAYLRAFESEGDWKELATLAIADTQADGLAKSLAQYPGDYPPAQRAAATRKANKASRAYSDAALKAGLNALESSYFQRALKNRYPVPGQTPSAEVSAQLQLLADELTPLPEATMSLAEFVAAASGKKVSAVVESDRVVIVADDKRLVLPKSHPAAKAVLESGEQQVSARLAGGKVSLVFGGSPQFDRIMTRAAGRKAIAFVEDGQVVLRQIFRGRDGQLMVARRQSGLKADYLAQIRKNLGDLKVSDSTIEKVLSPDPDRSEKIGMVTRRAVLKANEGVGFIAADNKPLSEWVAANQVVGFVTAAEGRLGRAVTTFTVPEQFDAFVRDLRTTEFNPSFVGADPDVVAKVVTSLDKPVAKGASGIGSVIADENAADPGEALDAKTEAEKRLRQQIAASSTVSLPTPVDREVVAELARFVARVRDAQLAANPDRTLEQWNAVFGGVANNTTLSQVTQLLESSGSEADQSLLQTIGAIDSAEVTLATIQAALNQAAKIAPRKAAKKIKTVSPAKEPDPIPYPAKVASPAAEYLAAKKVDLEKLTLLYTDVAKSAAAGDSLAKQHQSARPLIDLAKEFYASQDREFPDKTRMEERIDEAMNFAYSAMDGLRTVRSEPAAGLRVSATHSATRFLEAIRSAAGMGVTINAVQLRQDIADGFFNVSGGRIRPDKKTIDLVMAELATPSRSDLQAVFHEVLHSIVGNAPKAVQTALHTAFARLDMEKLAQRNNPEADVRLRSGKQPSTMEAAEWLEENFVEDRALRFIDKTYARNVFAYAWRALREIYFKASIWLQNQRGVAIDPGVAVGLVEARFARFAAGDYLNRFGGEVGLFDRLNRSTRMEQTAINLVGTQGVRLDPTTGKVTYVEAAGSNEAELLYNLSIPKEEFIAWVERGGYADAQALGLNTTRDKGTAAWKPLPADPRFPMGSQMATDPDEFEQMGRIGMDASKPYFASRGDVDLGGGRFVRLTMTKQGDKALFANVASPKGQDTTMSEFRSAFAAWLRENPEVQTIGGARVSGLSNGSWTVLSRDRLMGDQRTVRTRLAPNGQPSKLTARQWEQVRTPEFKAWFGDWENDPANASKVIDPETGEPMVVYHGSAQDFSEFRQNHSTKVDSGWLGEGFYFSESPDVSSGYAFEKQATSGGAPSVMPIFLSMKNPAYQYNWDAKERLSAEESRGNSAMKAETARLIAAGHDGVIWAVPDSPYMRNPKEFVVFNPTQIKSAIGNSGAFDGSDPDILRTVRSAAAAAKDDFKAQAEIHRARAVAMARVHVASYNTLHWRMVSAFKAAQAEGKAPATFAEFRRALGAPDYQSLRNTAIAGIESQGIPDHGINRELQVDDLTLPGELDRAELKVAQLARVIDDRVAEAESKARTLDSATRETYNRSVEALSKNVSEVKSLAITRQNARAFMRDQIDLLRRHVKQSDKLAASDGALRQTIIDLEEGVDDSIYEAYAKVLKSLAVDDVTLDRVLDAALEIRSGDRFGSEMSAREFFEAIKQAALSRPEMEVFFDRDRPGRPGPLVAAVHSYLVKQETITNYVRAAKFGADAQARLVAGMREIMSATTERELADMQEAVAIDSSKETVRLFKPKNGQEKLVFNKVLRGYFRTLAKNQELARQIRKAEATLVAAQFTRPLLRQLRTASEQRLQAALDFTLGDNATVIVPVSATDTPENLASESRFKTYQATTAGATSNREIAKWTQAQSRWLAARDNDPALQDRMYHTIKIQRDALQAHVQTEAETQLRTGVTSGIYEGITAFLRNSGTRAGQVASSMWVRYDDLQRRWQGRDRVAGKEWGAAGARLAKAAGLPNQAQTEELFFQPMAHVINEVPSDAADAFRYALARVQLNPKAKLALMRPGAMEAFKAYFTASAKASDYLTTKLKEAGVKVDDSTLISLGLDGDTSNLVRRQVQRGFRTFPRQLSQRVKAAVSAMKLGLNDIAILTGNKLDDPAGNELAAALIHQGSKNPALDPALKLWNDLSAISPDRLVEVRAVLKKFFNPIAIRDFVAPLVGNFESPTIPSPAVNGVTGGVVDPSLASAVWARSDDDVVTFAENLFTTLHPDGSANERADYRASVIRYFGQQFAKVNNLSDTQDGIRVASPLAVGHLGMDARIGEGFPQEWLDYMSFSDAHQRSASNVIAINTAFGRDMQGLLRQYETISNEVQQWARNYNELVTRVGSPNKRALLRDLRENGDLSNRPVTNPEAWLEKREAALSGQERLNFRSLVKMSGGLLNPDNGMTRDFTLPMEVFDTIIAGLLAAPKSAIKNLSSIIDLATFYRGSGFASLRAIAGGGTAALRQAIASGLSVFGIDAFKNSLANQRFERIGQLDPDRKLTWAQMINETGFNNHLEATAAGRAQAKIRAMRNLLTNYVIKPVGRERGEILAVGMRGPFGIFSWSQHISNLAVAESIFGEFERLVNRALARADRDPNYLDSLRSGAEIKGEDVGYSKGFVMDDRAAFLALQDHARQMGKPLEQLVLEAADRRGRDLDIFSDDTLSRLYSRAVTEVSLESSVVNNPVPIMGSTTGRVAFRLFRWSWAKQFKMLNMLKTPEGRTTLQSAIGGLLAVGLLMLPAGVLFSLMLEEYDDDVTGKASNLRPLGGSVENTLYSILERMTTTGTFGFAGDVGNSLLNSAGVSSGGAGKDGGVFSVDNRVVLLSLLNSMGALVSRASAQGVDNLTYASFFRQAAQVSGGGGALQYAQIMNNLANKAGFDAPFDEEAKVVARINANNLLRGAGRVLKLEGRAAGGAARANEMTPWVTEMVLASLSNDREGFNDAYRKSIEVARAMGKTDPVAEVKRSFGTRHPLKSLFRNNPSPLEIQQLYSVMGPAYAEEVRAALGNFNRYGQALGIEPFNGTEERRAVRPDVDLLAYRRGVTLDD